jgi:hypothetical protein
VGYGVEHKMKLVVVESPYAGDITKNIKYARACMANVLKRGESPYVSHLLYTQPGVLKDDVAHERVLGIEAGYAWSAKADLRAFYVDLGWSTGMKKALLKYRIEGQRYTFRVLGSPWSWLLAPLGPDGEEASAWSKKDRVLQRLNSHGAVSTVLFSAYLNIERTDLEELEAIGLIECDRWPNGGEYWRLCESLREREPRETILPPAPVSQDINGEPV